MKKNIEKTVKFNEMFGKELKKEWKAPKLTILDNGETRQSTGGATEGFPNSGSTNASTGTSTGGGLFS